MRAALAALCLAAAGCGARSPLLEPDALALDAAVADAVAPPDARPPLRCREIPALPRCQRTEGCRWLVPGCGEPQPPTGCYPSTECASNAECEPGLRCRRFDPCAGEPCSNCEPGVTFSVCLP